MATRTHANRRPGDARATLVRAIPPEDTMQPLEQLEHPVVRDLAWAVFSEDLILAGSLGSETHRLLACNLSRLTPTRLAWLQALDRAPGPLLAHVEDSIWQRLGLYFESLWHFFLDNDAEVDLLAHNLPVRDATRTLGEFDCLYRCRDSGDIVHLELAVKFYLHTGGGNSGTGDDRADWLGPGRRDRLDRKLDHLTTHQTRLAGQPAAQQLLRDRGLAPDRVEVAVKGRLFQRSDRPAPPPTGFNPAQSLLTWYHVDKLERSESEIESECQSPGWVILPRRHWLAPLAPAALCNMQDAPSGSAALRTALGSRFAARNAPLMIASLDEDCRELRRFFVAPTGWPWSPM